MTIEEPQPCEGFPDNCPNLVEVPADRATPPRHGGGVRCGCADKDLLRSIGAQDPRQPAYDAVFAYIRQQPVDFLPTTVVGRNAMIWHAVHAALDAVGVPGQAKQED